jgi:hypothetical protein
LLNNGLCGNLGYAAEANESFDEDRIFGLSLLENSDYQILADLLNLGYGSRPFALLNSALAVYGIFRTYRKEKILEDEQS